MQAALIIIAVFTGLSILTVTVIAGVMVAANRWTLPGTLDRRLHEAKTAARIAEYRHDQRLAEMNEQQTRLALDQLYESQQRLLQLKRGSE